MKYGFATSYFIFAVQKNYLYEKKLAEQQGFSMLSLQEYWKVLQDAKRAGDAQMVASLQGSNFVEFFDSKIINKRQLVDHDGKPKEVTVLPGSPGLIHPDDIDTETGLPTKVRLPNEYGNPELWRYWAPDADVVIPCRSYIFLLNQPCLDGKFHPEDSLPNLGIRPVVERAPEPDVTLDWNDKEFRVTIVEEGDTKEFKWPKRSWDAE